MLLVLMSLADGAESVPDVVSDACAALGAAGTCGICLQQTGLATTETAVGFGVGVVLVVPLVLKAISAGFNAWAVRRAIAAAADKSGVEGGSND